MCRGYFCAMIGAVNKERICRYLEGHLCTRPPNFVVDGDILGTNGGGRDTVQPDLIGLTLRKSPLYQHSPDSNRPQSTANPA